MTKLSKKAKSAAEMYALKTITEEQLSDSCKDIDEAKLAFEYARKYGEEYDHYLDGLKRASEYHLEGEYNYCYFTLHMSVEEALDEWDL